MPYRFAPINPGTPLDAIIAAINSNFAKIDGEAVVKTFSGPNNTNTLIQGRLPKDLGTGYLFYRADGTCAIAIYIDSTGEPILKVSKDGFDALTAGNSDLIFNSAQNIFKIITSGSLVVTRTGGNTSQYGEVGTGVIGAPGFRAYVNRGGSPSLNFPCPETISDGTTGAEWSKYRAAYDSTNGVLRLYVESTTINPDFAVDETVTFKYYVEQETSS